MHARRLGAAQVSTRNASQCNAGLRQKEYRAPAATLQGRRRDDAGGAGQAASGTEGVDAMTISRAERLGLLLPVPRAVLPRSIRDSGT